MHVAVCSTRFCGRHPNILIKNLLKSLIPKSRPDQDQALDPRVLDAEEHGLQVSSVSKGARKVADTLTQAGFSAELVGGCVRDLLLGERPKDFDVVTNASPEEVRQVFPRSRIIGRRFRIVHVRVSREVIEVSTYRAGREGDLQKETGTQSQSGRILRDNVFGTRDQDVFRRDFTANALYYDIGSNALIDYVDGFSDVKSRQLRFIGDPATRINEDPVRMLRSVRFKAKLDLNLDPHLKALCRDNAYLLRHVPPARLFDEVLKLFHSGYAVKTFELLREFGLFAELFPEAERSYGEVDLDPKRGLVLRGLENTDGRIKKRKPVIAAFLFSCIFWTAVRRQRDRQEEKRRNNPQVLQRVALEVLSRESQRVMIPRRVSTVVVEIWELQSRLEARRPRTIQRILGNRRFRAA
ncbi:MAG TPA: polynucleotide adenylyltransferase PcnB, partial [Gammaproteobacteria bacterium]|nr:polynucleotide adenylyltransferase PcnB [Gammaproteobacteria bacterium]